MSMAGILCTICVQVYFLPSDDKVAWTEQTMQTTWGTCLLYLLGIHCQSGFLQKCFSMALSSVKRCFPSNSWYFPAVISVISGNATNPLTQKPAEVRSSLGHSHIVWGSKRNGWMRRVRRSKIIHSLLSLPRQGEKVKKGKLWKIGDPLQSAPGTELLCAACPPSSSPSVLAGPRIRSKPLATRASIGNRSAEGLWDWTHNLPNY